MTAIDSHGVVPIARECAGLDTQERIRTLGRLAIAQNGAPTGLFRNVGARSGLRVRLTGPGGNPEGVGAQLRLRWGDRLGPARELHAGSGYGSQDSLVPVHSAGSALKN